MNAAPPVQNVEYYLVRSGSVRNKTLFVSVIAFVLTENTNIYGTGDV